MTEKSIKRITVLMAASMVGLVAFQSYWINNVLKVGEEQFNQSVHDAINAVTLGLEQQEILYTAEQKLKFNQGGVTVISHDSIRFISKSKDSNQNRNFITEETVRKFFTNTDTIDLRDPNYSQRFDSEGQTLREGQFIDDDVLIEISRSRSEIDTVQEYDEQLKRDIAKVREKSEMVMVVLNELISRERKISNRISKEQVDSVLHTNLLNRGIDTEYAFAVVNDQTKEVLISDNNEYNNEVLKSEFRTKLFKNDLIDQHSYLFVYFPSKSVFIFSKIFISLLGSLIFLLVVIFCFGYAIYTIKKQKQISEIKNDFINNMTHELKTPISTVSLACEALQDPDISKSGNFTDRYISIIKDETNRLGMQVEKVLQMATLDKKEFKLKLESLDMHEVIDNAIQHINLQIEKRGGEIVKQYNAKRKEVVADEVHMTNIIYNLLDNANKYSQDHPQITIKTDNVNGGIMISVVDNGIGMSKEVQAKIFDKFYRVPTGNLHDVKGFGLGLAYVKTMLTALGGKIGVKSIMNKGSEFEIYLPQHG